MIVYEESDVPAFANFTPTETKASPPSQEAPAPSAPAPPKKDPLPTPPPQEKAAPPKPAPPPSAPTPSARPTSPEGRVIASPLAKRLAAEQGLNLQVRAAPVVFKCLYCYYRKICDALSHS